MEPARPSTAKQICTVHAKHPVRAELHAVSLAVDVNVIAGTGGIEYAFQDGSKLCFLGIGCFVEEGSTA
jgi:hypothetical protein